jgi:hypothetical protein
VGTLDRGAGSEDASVGERVLMAARSGADSCVGVTKLVAFGVVEEPSSYTSYKAWPQSIVAAGRGRSDDERMAGVAIGARGRGRRRHRVSP